MEDGVHAIFSYDTGYHYSRPISGDILKVAMFKSWASVIDGYELMAWVENRVYWDHEKGRHIRYVGTEPYIVIDFTTREREMLYDCYTNPFNWKWHTK